MTEHTLLSPSGGHRWSRCAASVRAEAGRQDDAGDHAALGTVGHQIRALSLSLDASPFEFVGDTMKVGERVFTVTKEMAYALQGGIDRLLEMPGQLYVEHRVDLGAVLPGQSGTLDAGIIGKREIVINDLKYGYTPVTVFDTDPVTGVTSLNEQLGLYALGFWHTVAKGRTKAKRFRLIIDQPNIPTRGSEGTVTLDELLAFGERMAAAAEATEDPDAPFTPGEIQCRYCKARRDCAARAGFMFDLIQAEFDDDGLDEVVPPLGMTPERRSLVLLSAGALRKWLEELEAEARQDYSSGRPTPGLKLVEPSRMGNRKWADEKAAEKFLFTERRLSHEDAFNYSLITPPQAATKLGKTQWRRAQALITRSPGKPQLVSVHDERPALSNVLDMFDDEDDDI